MEEQNILSEALISAGDIVKNLPDDIKNEAMKGPAKEIGEGIGNLAYVVFSPLLIARTRIEHKVKKMRAELDKSIINIPPDKLVEPALNIVGPALEGSKYYIEDDNIRGYFVRLISSAANIDKRDMVHPSFVEIIKQMSPFDAKCLDFLVKEQSNTASGTIRVNNDGGLGFHEVKYLFPFPGITRENMELYMSSVDNLMRLGILKASEGKFVKEKRYETLHSIVGKLANEIEQELKEENQEATATLVETAWVFSELGLQFINSCVVEERVDIN